MKGCPLAAIRRSPASEVFLVFRATDSYLRHPAALPLQKAEARNYPPRGTIRTMLTADQIRELLQMRQHPIEGGYFAETYTSAQTLGKDRALPSSFSHGERLLSTAIYYLLTPDTFSAMHRLPGDEIFHFYLGDPIEMLQLSPDGKGELILIGQDLEAGAIGCSRPSRETIGMACALVSWREIRLAGNDNVPGL